MINGRGRETVKKTDSEQMRKGENNCGMVGGADR